MTEESKEMLSAMKDMFEVLNNKIDELDSKMNSLETKVSSVELTLEVKTNRNIQLLVEGHMQNAEKLDQLEQISDGVEYIKLKTDVLEAVTKVHSYDINHLKKVK